MEYKVANSILLDNNPKIVLNYDLKELGVVRCCQCHGIIGEELSGSIILKCRHCGQKQKIVTA